MLDIIKQGKVYFTFLRGISFKIYFILLTLNNFVQKGEKVKNISLVCKDINLKGTFSRYETLKQNLKHKDLDSLELIFFTQNTILGALYCFRNQNKIILTDILRPEPVG